MTVRFKLGDYNKHLWTREKAREIRRDLVAILSRAKAGETVILDLKGVEVFDFSFANEFFGKTVFSLPVEFPDRYVIVENLTSDTRENLVHALEGMKLAMIVRKGSQLELIGKVHQSDIQTFDAIRRSRTPCTAMDLASRLGTNLTTMNERLNKLTALALVRRMTTVSAAGRTQYEYVVPQR